MCQVDSFFCGCADLRKGTLIIGVIELVNMMTIDYDGDEDDNDNDHNFEDNNWALA